MLRPQPRHQHREHQCGLEAVEVGGVGEQPLEVLQPHPFDTGAEGILLLQRLHQRLARRPEEEHRNDDQLRRQQQPGQPGRLEENALFSCHAVMGSLGSSPLGGEVGRGAPGRRRSQQVRQDLLAFSNRSSSSLPRVTAVSRASLGVFLPDQICSVSSSMMVRI
jgi:hypothetical protein